MARPKVSVAVTAYNKEPYIVEAIESVLAQQNTFPSEVVIGEDCSTDRTREIVLDYAKKYPAIIRALVGEKNLGVAANYARTIEACTGEYIALLDGDDYWSDPYKLQKQVQYLDAHPECSVCFHPATKIREAGQNNPLWNDNSWHNAPPGKKPFYTLKDLLEGSFMATSATMFRSGLFGKFPAWFYHQYVPDYALHILNGQYGLFGYIDEDMSVYREHAGGIWSGADYLKHQKGVADLYRDVDRHLNYEYSGILQTTKRLARVAELYLGKADRKSAKSYLKSAFRAYPRSRCVRLTKLIGLWLILYAPSVYPIASAAKQKLGAILGRKV